MPKIRNKNKVESVTFDESARREFITGFRKRKLEKQKKRQQNRAQQEKEEKKALKKEKRGKLAEVQEQMDLIESINNGCKNKLKSSEDSKNEEEKVVESQVFSSEHQVTTVTIETIDSD